MIIYFEAHRSRIKTFIIENNPKNLKITPTFLIHLNKRELIIHLEKEVLHLLQPTNFHN